MNLNKTLSILAGVMLLLAIPPIWPYGYYQLLRWVVTLISISNALKAQKLNLRVLMLTMVFIAILFNPIAPITFKKEIWAIIDFIVAIVIFINSTKFENKYGRET